MIETGSGFGTTTTTTSHSTLIYAGMATWRALVGQRAAVVGVAPAYRLAQATVRPEMGGP